MNITLIKRKLSIYLSFLLIKFRKSDVMNMLETAGFASSNPYRIIEQGMVTSLTTMSDEERLKLLNQIAGTIGKWLYTSQSC